MLITGITDTKNMFPFHSPIYVPMPYLALSDKVCDIWELETWKKNKTFITSDYFNGNLRESITEVLYIVAYKGECWRIDWGFKNTTLVRLQIFNYKILWLYESQLWLYIAQSLILTFGIFIYNFFYISHSFTIK